MKKTRYFAAVFTGNMLFFFLYAGVAWVLTLLNATPYGKLVNTFFRGRTKEEAAAFVEKNRALFEQMLADASFFANLVINPAVAFAAGFAVGAILNPDRKMAVLWSSLTVVPVSLLLLVKSAGDPLRLVYFVLLLVAASVGGFVASGVVSKKLSEKKNVIP